MSLREEQCNKVCRILDDVLANRPTERDSLIVAVRKAFAQPKRGRWILHTYLPHHNYCSICEKDSPYNKRWNFCPNCGCRMNGDE